MPVLALLVCGCSSSTESPTIDYGDRTPRIRPLTDFDWCPRTMTDCPTGRDYITSDRARELLASWLQQWSCAIPELGTLTVVEECAPAAFPIIVVHSDPENLFGLARYSASATLQHPRVLVDSRLVAEAAAPQEAQIHLECSVRINRTQSILLLHLLHELSHLRRANGLDQNSIGRSIVSELCRGGDNDTPALQEEIAADRWAFAALETGLTGDEFSRVEIAVSSLFGYLLDRRAVSVGGGRFPDLACRALTLLGGAITQNDKSWQNRFIRENASALEDAAIRTIARARLPRRRFITKLGLCGDNLIAATIEALFMAPLSEIRAVSKAEGEYQFYHPRFSHRWGSDVDVLCQEGSPVFVQYVEEHASAAFNESNTQIAAFPPDTVSVGIDSRGLRYVRDDGHRLDIVQLPWSGAPRRVATIEGRPDYEFVSVRRDAILIGRAVDHHVLEFDYSGRSQVLFSGNVARTYVQMLVYPWDSTINGHGRVMDLLAANSTERTDIPTKSWEFLTRFVETSRVVFGWPYSSDAITKLPSFRGGVRGVSFYDPPRSLFLSAQTNGRVIALFDTSPRGEH